MNIKGTDFIHGDISEFNWYNEPAKYSFNNGLIIKTSPYTDFWQKTHYGFQRDDGHCYLTEKIGDFSFTAQLKFESKEMYDQCGIMARIDENNWVKASIEYENEQMSRLGSVATNLGYSDWATTDISTDIKMMWYRMSKNNKDILIENSYDGVKWKQMRILHLHKYSGKILIGVYACSPKDSCFECQVKKIIIGQNTWKYDD